MTAKIKLDTDEVIRLYLEDRLTTQKIADLFGCSRFPIESLLRANNVEARSNHVGKYFEKEIVELYSSGLKVHEIQERLGLKRDAVIGRLKKNGISLTTPRELCSSRFYKTSPCWKGYEDIPLSVYSHIAKRARHNNIEISIRFCRTMLYDHKFSREQKWNIILVGGLIFRMKYPLWRSRLGYFPQLLLSW